MDKHKCPVCGKFEFDMEGSYDFCELCGWQDDSYQEDHPDEENCANELSLNQYRKEYLAGNISYEIIFSKYDEKDYSEEDIKYLNSLD